MRPRNSGGMAARGSSAAGKGALEAIRDVLHSYARALDRRDGDNILPVEEIAGRERGSAGPPGARYFVRGQPSIKDPSYLRFGTPTLRRETAPIRGMRDSYLAARQATQT